MRRDVRCLVVAEREAVVAAAARGEAVVALDPAGVPPVAGDPMLAAAVRVRLGGRRRQVARHQGLVLGVGVVLVLAPADVEAVAVLGAAGVEIRRIGAQPPEVVVEGTVLHDEHHDRVDRRVRPARGRAAGVRRARLPRRGRVRRHCMPRATDRTRPRRRRARSLAGTSAGSSERGYGSPRHGTRRGAGSERHERGFGDIRRPWRS